MRAKTRRAHWFAWASAALFALVLASCASSQCNFNSQCGDKHYCEDSRCFQDCVANSDCRDGLECDAVGRCVQPGPDAGRRDSGTTDAGPRRDAGPHDAGVRDVGVADTNPPRDTGTDAGPPGRKAYLESCSRPEECESSVCTPEGLGATSVCAKTCASDGDCADWHFCLRAEGSGTGFCTFDDVGLPCDGGDASGGDCEFACIFSSSAGHCTHDCRSAADCPGGYGCHQTDPMNPSSLRVCAWDHRACPIDQYQCPTSIGGCGGEGSQCTSVCQTAADCPWNYEGYYTCETVLPEITFPICRPPNAGSKASGEVCTTNDECRSSLCATPPDGRTPICLESCTPQSGCAYGFGCNAMLLPDTGTAINACVPAGIRKSGETCARNDECRSGFCSTLGRCADSCLGGYCPPSQTCRTESITVEGITWRTCR